MQGGVWDLAPNYSSQKGGHLYHLYSHPYDDLGHVATNLRKSHVTMCVDGLGPRVQQSGASSFTCSVANPAIPGTVQP